MGAGSVDFSRIGIFMCWPVLCGDGYGQCRGQEVLTFMLRSLSDHASDLLWGGRIFGFVRPALLLH